MYFFGEEKEALGFFVLEKKRFFVSEGRKTTILSPNSNNNKNKRDLKRSKGIIIKIIRLNNKNNINNKKRYK